MLKVTVNNEKELDISFNDKDSGSGIMNNKEFLWDVQLVKNACGCYHIIKDNKSYNTSVLDYDSEKKSFTINVSGNAYQVTVSDEHDQLLKSMGLDIKTIKKTNEVKAPMPGLVKEIKVKEGDEVVQGQSLLILEAMKMENVIKSPIDGVIRKIEAEKDKAVDKGQVLIRFK